MGRKILIHHLSSVLCHLSSGNERLIPQHSKTAEQPNYFEGGRHDEQQNLQFQSGTGSASARCA